MIILVLQHDPIVKIAKLAEDVYRTTLDASRSESRKGIIRLEHNKILSISLAHCPYNPNGGSFLNSWNKAPNLIHWE